MQALSQLSYTPNRRAAIIFAKRSRCKGNTNRHAHLARVAAQPVQHTRLSRKRERRIERRRLSRAEDGSAHRHREFRHFQAACLQLGFECCLYSLLGPWLDASKPIAQGAERRLCFVSDMLREDFGRRCDVRMEA